MLIGTEQGSCRMEGKGGGWREGESQGVCDHAPHGSDPSFFTLLTFLFSYVKLMNIKICRGLLSKDGILSKRHALFLFFSIYRIMIEITSLCIL